MVIFNHQNPMFQDKRVRWALALMLDPVEMSMASYRGAATLSAIAMPPTGTHTDDYFAPLQDWLINYELDTGTQKIKPYDPDRRPEDRRHRASAVRRRRADRRDCDPQLLRLRLVEEGCRRPPANCSKPPASPSSGGKWMMPDGTPFAFTIKTFQEGVINRLGTDIAQQWTQAGVARNGGSCTAHLRRTTCRLGNYEAATAWSIETWGGNPDLSFFLDSWHSEFLVPSDGERQPARNWQRWSDPRLDAIIEKVRTTDFNDNARPTSSSATSS